MTLGRGPSTIALDGEREIEITDASAAVSVRVDPHGPRVVDVEAALAAGAAAGVFVRTRSPEVNPTVE